MTISLKFIKLNKLILTSAILLGLHFQVHGTNKYHNYSEFSANLEKVARKNPNWIDLKSIAQSRQGRDIWLVSNSDTLKHRLELT